MIRALAVFLLCCAAGKATLIDRYSFTTDASDSVGGNNGTLEGTATVSGGALQLDGTAGYVSLPSDFVSGLHSFTMEVWFTWSDNGAWSRLFDFGSSQTNFMYLTPRNGDTDTPLFGIATTTGSLHTVTSPDPIAPGTPIFIAITLDSATLNDPAVMYINGVFAAGAAVVYDPSQLGPTANNWFGRSEWSTNPLFQGSIDEFRIYDTVLPADVVAREFATGADEVSTPEPGSAGLLLCGLCLLAARSVRPRTQHPPQ